MDPIEVMKFMIKKAQCAIKKLGPTNRSRWVIISPFDELTPSQFSTQLMKYDVSVNTEEVKKMWEMAGILTPTIDFQSFVRFLCYNMASSAYDPALSFFDSLVQFRNVLLTWFTANDPNCTGCIEYSKFCEIVRKVRPQTTDVDFASLMKQYDQSGSGTVNYFILLADLGAHTSPHQIVKGDTLTTESLWVPPALASDSSGTVAMNRLNLPAVLYPSARGPGNGGRGPLDADIFPELARSRAPQTPTVRRNSFSELHEAEHVPERREIRESPRTPQKLVPQSRTEKPKQDTSATVEAARLAQKIQEQGGAQQFFNKWQKDGRLGVQEIHSGLFTDTEYDFPVERIATIVNGNGGPFNLSEFVAYNSAALRKPVSTADLISLREQAENDVVITRIAERTYGRMWTEAVQNANTVSEFVKGLQSVQVFVFDDDIRSMFEQNGKDMLITMIKNKQREMFCTE